jgi:DNA polymerase III subunit beta
MKLIVIKGNLKEGLGIVERASGDTSTLPVLKNVLIEAVENKIHLTATNLEIAISYVVPGKILEAGRITAPLRVFADLINNLQSERLNIEVKERALELKTDNYQAMLQGVAADEFPLVPQIKDMAEWIEMEGEVLKSALAQIVSSAQSSELRPELNTVLFDFSLDQLKLVATDSFRLAEKTIPANQFKSNREAGFRILVPARTALEVSRIVKDDEKVRIYHDENQILFQTEQLSCISRLVSGNFPDYTAITPKSFETEVVLDRQELMNALKVAGVFTSKVSEIKVKIGEGKKNIEVFSNDQMGENNYLIPAKISGKSKEISFNWRYILDGLRAMDTEDVYWGINEENRPALLKSPNDGSFFYIVMPILKA